MMEGAVGGAVWALVAALGLALGSFANVVIARLPAGESIVRPRSRCPSCRSPIEARDNVPVLSFLWLRGRCRRCQAPISPRYPAVELLSCAVFLALFAVHGATLETGLWWAFALLLVIAAAVDFDHGFIPDEVSLGGLGLGLVALPGLRVLAGEAVGAALPHALLGAALGAGVLWTVGFVHARLSVAFGRSFPHWPGEGEAPPRPGSLDYWVWFPGLGFGDVKLIGMVGAFLGPLGVIQTLLLASLVALPFGVLQVRGQGLTVPFGFGPALAGAALGVAIFAPAQVWPF